MNARPALSDRLRSRPLPPCCLPGGFSATAPTSVLDALEARPATLLALAAVLMLALGPTPAAAQEMATICTPSGLQQVPLDGERQPDSGTTGCAHACLPRDRRRG